MERKYIISVLNCTDIKTYALLIEELGDDTLRHLQTRLKGNIECADWLFPELYERKIDCWINEDNTGLPKTITHTLDDGHRITVYGNLCFTSFDEEGNTVGLTIEEAYRVILELGDMGLSSIPSCMRLSREDIDEWEEYLNKQERIKSISLEERPAQYKA